MGRIDNLLVRWGPRTVLMASGIWVLVFVGMFAGLWRMRWTWAAYAVATVVLTAIVIQWTNVVRERYVREAALPQFLKRKLREAYPHLNQKDCELVERGLRQFFMACMRSRKQFVAMPSKAVDAMWHEFILHTQAYKTWCERALGFFLHHTPAEALGARAKNNDGLRRAWYWACKDEGIHPKYPSRLPLLFALDAKLAIAGGFAYVPDCRDIIRKSDAGGDASGTYCGTHFANSGYSGSSGDFGGAESSSSHSSSSSSSDGSSGDAGGDGGSCGGGCGGGGGD
ncbi:hypothetical protein ASF11_13325 [Acidovorax sp. Leaf76]|uniref:glycine-rich domain-containing protein n=1 Tax=unclassified Acidovorax TaxID=2684926 RepID=UPI000700A9E4|nr:MULTISPECIES: hypothetical protein [unclassified Acidovorax]KQO14635.1 hypothetical protein ASF11_13325 [Acidovorax sp. Leaf76]KQO36947.1 hypothetical protein ASF19_21765 [Acidovorax sp. Leaf84]KQS29669.1 hypothetical protein ASG27_15155 [Acidovorax sp. Leaf191]